MDVGGGAIDPFRILGACSRVNGNLLEKKCWDNGIHDFVSLHVSVALSDLNDPREIAPAMKSVSSWPWQISNFRFCYFVDMKPSRALPLFLPLSNFYFGRVTIVDAVLLSLQ